MFDCKPVHQNEQGERLSRLAVKINDTDPIDPRSPATSSRAGVQFESKRIDHLHDGHELGIALLAQRLV